MRAHLDRKKVMEGEAPSIHPGRGPRRSRDFSGVFGTFPGILKNYVKGLGEYGEEEEENYVEGEYSDGTALVPAPVGEAYGT
ncbi:hypothetical protein O181_049131 [Austropuccinia psidii MF-1]|uniref:Uncharacterized protein n=1 Tax=Austropuccinia psidii MF-1 TaxID=1389203 RepID=A0A9Q3DRV4_9BASI|nr:hypothetical protein [Austropuccinia psidii MF-1]